MKINRILVLLFYLLIILPNIALASSYKEVEINIPVKVEYKYSKNFKFELKNISNTNNIPEIIIKESKDGKLSFGPLKFVKPGRHKFEVKQVIEDNQNIIYDKSVYILNIFVENGEDNYTNNLRNLKTSLIVNKENLNIKSKELLFENQIIETETETETETEKIDEGDNPRTGDSGIFPMIILFVIAVISIILLRKNREF